jgi:cytochrome c
LAVNVPGAGGLRRSAAILKGRRYREFLVVLGLVGTAAAYVAVRGFDFVPGQQPESAFCASDIGDRLDRHGHSEEMLWRGCLIASDTGRHLSRFAPARDLFKAAPDNAAVPSCLSCHDGAKAESFAELWTRFPRYNERTGKVEDFAQAIQDEIELRYGGIRPNRSDNAITALYFYAAAKAAQAGLTFRVEDASASPLAEEELEGLAPSGDCRAKFGKTGWPRGPNAAGVIRGCNLVTDTREHLRGPIARRWRTDVTCQSCHLEAGDRPHAGSLAHAAVVLPHMYTAVNQPIRFDRRVLLCFSNSQNAYDLGLDAREVTDINLYANWLAQKAELPIGAMPEGRGIPLLYDAQGLGASFLAGERVYQQYCQACHGVNGLGGAGPIFRGREPPPIAGPHSFGAAASLTDPYRLAGFVHANMPVGATLEHPILTVQQALDVSMYLTSLGRPADFTRVNQVRVFLNHLWLRTVVGIGSLLSSLRS